MTKLTVCVLVGVLAAGCTVVQRNPMHAPDANDAQQVQVDEQMCVAQVDRAIEAVRQSNQHSFMVPTFIGGQLGVIDFGRPGVSFVQRGRIYRSCMRALGYTE